MKAAGVLSAAQQRALSRHCRRLRAEPFEVDADSTHGINVTSVELEMRVGEEPAISIRIDRSDRGDAIRIQRQVEDVAESLQATLPEGVRPPPRTGDAARVALDLPGITRA